MTTADEKMRELRAHLGPDAKIVLGKIYRSGNNAVAVSPDLPGVKMLMLAGTRARHSCEQASSPKEEEKR